MADNGTAVRRARPRGKPQDGELSAERIAFCEGILEGKGYRVAYEESGFKAKRKDAATNARQLLKEPEVRAYLAARRVEFRETKRTAAERVIDEVSAVAFASLAEFGAYELRGPDRSPQRPRRRGDASGDGALAVRHQLARLKGGSDRRGPPNGRGEPLGAGRSRESPCCSESPWYGLPIGRSIANTVGKE